MKNLFIGVLTLTGMLAAQAQIKEGSITYNVNFEGMPAEQASMMKGTEMKIYFKDKKSRSEFTNAFFNTITVSDENSSVTLMEQMGQKQFYKMKKEDIEKESTKTSDPKITYIEEKKTIAGYECKKAIIEAKSEKGETNKVDVWYTDKIQGPSGNSGGRMGASQFKGLKGAPLEFSMQQGPMKMQMTAKNVSTTPVTDAKFAVSTDGYTEIKLDDLKKQRSGS
jgi:GLPGLI family protein